MCQTWHCGAQLCSQPPEEKVVQQKKPTTEGRNVNQDLQHPNSLPSTQKKTSSRHIRTDSKELAGSQGCTTSPYAVMQNPSYMHCGSAQLQCGTVREKLDEFLEQGIITPVEEPMDWVSSLAYSWKANGKLRVCLDPRDVNKAIKRDHYKTPTVEEITHLLAGSKKFTKVDGTSSYLCIVLDYESSLLTTFNTPWEDTDSYDSPRAYHVPRTSSSG